MGGRGLAKCLLSSFNCASMKMLEGGLAGITPPTVISSCMLEKKVANASIHICEYAYTDIHVYMYVSHVISIYIDIFTFTI